MKHLLYSAPILIRGRIVADNARSLLLANSFRQHTEVMADLVDNYIDKNKRLGGSVEYLSSFEDTSDWEIVVATEVAVSSAERFSLSMKIGDALNEVLRKTGNDSTWAHISFRLDLASVK